MNQWFLDDLMSLDPIFTFLINIANQTRVYEFNDTISISISFSPFILLS